MRPVEPGDGVSGEGAGEDVSHGFGFADGVDGDFSGVDRELPLERCSVDWLGVGDICDGLDLAEACSVRGVRLLPGRAESCRGWQGDGGRLGRGSLSGCRESAVGPEALSPVDAAVDAGET